MNGPAKLVRRDWVAACHFHDLTEEEVLREVSRRLGGHQQPLVLLDLDSTLYEVGPRTFQILKEWAASPAVAASAEFAGARGAIEGLALEHVGYSLQDTFQSLGVEPGPETAAALRKAKRFWIERFFSSAYLKYDRPYPGAAAFARELHGLGAGLIYLTGRDEPSMGAGTRENLLRDGFPWEVPRTHLLLKAERHLEDLRHKVEAAGYVRSHGTLVASFENEPPNLVALYREFPEAMHVFVDTVCSDHGAEPCDGLYRIAGFEATA